MTRRLNRSNALILALPALFGAAAVGQAALTSVAPDRWRSVTTTRSAETRGIWISSSTPTVVPTAIPAARQGTARQ